MSARKDSILFLCVHNSARSQMAEALLRERCPNDFVTESAGLEPGTLNPLAVEVMREIGIDISHKTTQSAFDLFKAGRVFGYVISVCDESNDARCPIFPGITRRLNWSLPDPSSFEGSWEERLAQTRTVRDQLKTRIDAWCAEMCPPKARTG